MRLLRLTTVLLILTTTSLSADDRHLHLSIGDPDRSQSETTIGIDLLVDTASGKILSPVELAAALADTGVLFVGESHTDIEFHRVQLRVLEELVAAGREVLIGLEMYPYTEQEYLDAWVAGEYDEQGFLDASRWYERWGYHWGYYREIFQLAREHELPMFAINAPRDVVRSVRKKGFDDLTEEEAAHIPTQIDIDSDEQRQMFRAMFDEEDEMHMQMTEEQWEGMFQAQCTWDATMGFNAVKALKEHGGDNAIMVVLIGSGHVAYGLGIERQSGQWFDGEMASLIPISTTDEDGEPIERVQSSYANYLWGLPGQTDSFYPSLGMSAIKMGEDPYRQVVYVGEDTVAERAGIQVGDVLLTMDGIDLLDKEALNRTVAGRHWGDLSSITVRREGEPVEIPVRFTRSSPESED